MLQKDLLFPWRTILDNVCLGLEISEVPKKERHERAMDYLLKYGLGISPMPIRPRSPAGCARERR